MDKLRLYSIISLGSLTVASLLAILSAFLGWVIVTVALVCISLLIIQSSLLFIVRHLKWHSLSSERRVQKENKQLLTDLIRTNREIDEIKSQLNKLRLVQEDSLVVVEARIGNLESRIQRVLDLRDSSRTAN